MHNTSPCSIQQNPLNFKRESAFLLRWLQTNPRVSFYASFCCPETPSLRVFSSKNLSHFRLLLAPFHNFCKLSFQDFKQPCQQKTANQSTEESCQACIGAISDPWTIPEQFHVKIRVSLASAKLTEINKEVRNIDKQQMGSHNAERIVRNEVYNPYASNSCGNKLGQFVPKKRSRDRRYKRKPEGLKACHPTG